MDIKRLAESLVKKFGTRDPIRIAEELGYIIIYTPLVGVRGFYQYLAVSYCLPKFGTG